jgi:uncharacterized protein YbaR (Trm112 family)
MSEGEETISKDLLEILACPFCKKDIRLEGTELVSDCGLRYKIEDGIPHMLYPICPDCKIETEMTKENHEFEFVCKQCGKKLSDKTE